MIKLVHFSGQFILTQVSKIIQKSNQSFQAFGKLYALGTQIACSCDNNDMYATAATNGEETSVLLTNLGEQTTVELNVPHFKAYLIDQNNTYTEMEVQDNRFNVEKHQVIYIEI